MVFGLYQIIRRIGQYGIFHIHRMAQKHRRAQTGGQRTTIATTLDIYSHVLPGMQEEAALHFDEGMVKARIERETDIPKTAGSRSG